MLLRDLPSTHSQSAVKLQIEKRVQYPLYRSTVNANITIADIDGRPFMYEFVSQLVVMVGDVDDVIRNRDLRSYRPYHLTAPAK